MKKLNLIIAFLIISLLAISCGKDESDKKRR